MNKKYFAKFRVKDTVLKRELIRAHATIILLVICLMGYLAASSVIDSNFNTGLVSIVVVLLAFVAIISLSVILALRKK